jgi:hypothetical protein
MPDARRPPKLVLPPSHPYSINTVFKHIKKRYMLFLTAFSWLVVNILIIILFANHDHYNLSMYTYWNFLAATLLHVLVMVGEVCEGYVEGIIALLYAPMAIGSIMLVPLIVSLVIFLDASTYLNGTVCAGGLMSMNKVRTGDWILHGMPVLEVGMLLFFGYLYYWRTVLFHFNRSRHFIWSLLHIVYFVFCPAIPMGIYAAFNNIAKKYPVPWHTWQLVLACLAIDVVVMTLIYIGLVMNTNETHVLIQFYPTRSSSSSSSQTSLLPLKRPPAITETSETRKRGRSVSR